MTNLVISALLFLAELPMHSVTSIYPGRLQGSVIHVGSEGAQVHADVLCGKSLELQWTGQSDRLYVVEQSFDLITWHHIPVLHVGENKSIVWPTTTAEPQSFYRVVQL